MTFVITSVCIDCAVYVGASPVAAIYDHKDLAAQVASLFAVNARWFADKAAARSEVRRLKG